VATGQLNLVLQQLRRTVRRQLAVGLADGELLERFTRHGDEAAFEVLVWRHGPLVLSLCHRLLHNSHDAEDVLQATFLTLVKKAGSIGKRDALGSWLYKVAYRIVLRVRETARKRKENAAPVEDLPAAAAPGDPRRGLLDEAIDGLPEHYRAALVLCYLQGKSHKEIAEELGCPLGTVSTRLARGREMLRKHFARRGVPLAAGTLGTVLAQHAVSAPVCPLLVIGTVKAATSVAAGPAAAGGVISANVAALTQEAVKTMFVTKLKAAAALGVAGLLAGGLHVAGLWAVPRPALAEASAVEISNAPAVDTPSAVVVPAALRAAQPDKEKAVTYLDLQPKANQKLNETLRGAILGNHLEELKQGKQTLEGLKFNIGEGMVLLPNTRLKDVLPEKVEGIKVDAKFAKLHILHGTGWVADDETVIAKYVVRYVDKSEETIEVVYGQDVCDWWRHDGDKEPPKSKVAWQGWNEPAKAAGCSIWLFATTWKNPHPDRRVVSIDFESMVTTAAPFVVAMTVEEE
jgi:RNA polymerase sigma factor (sigma-70 family)